GTTPGADNVVDPMANPATGQLLVARIGSIQGTSWQLNGLTAGQTYYWSVQAVSPSLVGSTFAPAQSFNTNYPAFTILDGASLTLNARALGIPAAAGQTYTWTVDGQANAARGASVTLTWELLQSLGIDEGPATFPVDLAVSTPDGMTLMRQATITLA